MREPGGEGGGGVNGHNYATFGYELNQCFNNLQP